MNMLEDRSVHDKLQWDTAVKFMETSVGEKLRQSECTCVMVTSCVQQLLVMPHIDIESSAESSRWWFLLMYTLFLQKLDVKVK